MNASKPDIGMLQSSVELLSSTGERDRLKLSQRLRRLVYIGHTSDDNASAVKGMTKEDSEHSEVWFGTLYRIIHEQLNISTYQKRADVGCPECCQRRLR